MVADRPPIFRSFPRRHLFFLDLVIFTWNLRVGKEKKNLGWATVWRYGTQYDSKTHAFKLSPIKTRILTALFIFPHVCLNNFKVTSQQDYENMFTLRCRYTTVTKLTTHLLLHSLWPCNLHSTWERKKTLHSCNTTKHICSCIRNSVDNTKLLCNY